MVDRHRRQLSMTAIGTRCSFTILESDSVAKIYWKSKDGDQTSNHTWNRREGAFKPPRQFKIETLGNENHSVKYGYVLFRLKNSKGEKT